MGLPLVAEFHFDISPMITSLVFHNPLLSIGGAITITISKYSPHHLHTLRLRSRSCHTLLTLAPDNEGQSWQIS